jgi:putative membrane protein
MWWWHGDWSGWAWLAMSISMMAFWGLVIFGVVSAIRHIGTSEPSDPERILRQRFARGEIDVDEYERRRDLLRR